MVLFTKLHPIYSDFFYSKKRLDNFQWIYFDPEFLKFHLGKKIVELAHILHVDAASFNPDMRRFNKAIFIECEGLARDEWFEDKKIGAIIFQSKYAGRKQLAWPKSHLVYPGFSLSVPVNKSFDNNKILILLSVGFGSFIKGFDVSFEIFQRLKTMGYKVKLILAGSLGHNYEYYPEVERAAYDAAGFDDILAYAAANNDLDLCPFSREELIGNIYPQADILMHFSRMETFGYSLLEAMNFGIPIVSVKFKAIPELVDHGRSGFLCNPFQWDGVSPIEERTINTISWKNQCVLEGLEQVKKLIDQPTLRKEVSANAKEMARTFGFESRSMKLNKIYDSLKV